MKEREFSGRRNEIGWKKKETEWRPIEPNDK